MSTDYYSNKEFVGKYIKMTEGMNGQFMVNELAPLIKENAAVLEIGTGPGNDWILLNERYHVTGSDFSAEFIKHLTTKYPQESFLNLDAATLDTDKKFDAIFSNKVLHHLKDDELQSSIKRQFEILNTNGIICHSFWKGNGTEDYNGMFVNMHTKDALSELLKGKFEIITANNYMEFEENDSFYLIAKKIS